MRVKHQITTEKRLERFRKLLAKHKDRIEQIAKRFTTVKEFSFFNIEFASITLAANIPTFLVSVYYKWYVWIPITAAVYGAAAYYPNIIKMLNRGDVDPKRQKERETFARAEFGAGVPAVLASYAALNLVSNGSIDNHVLTVCATWLAGRALGVPAWMYLWKNDNSELYERTGWRTGSLIKSFFRGITRNFSEKREGTANEIIEQWGYGRTMDWWFLISKPLVMQSILLYGLTGEKAFAIYGIINDILNEIYYGFYFTPRFYPEMTKRLRDRLETYSNFPFPK